MRVVVDTNILVSAGLKQGSPPSIALNLAAQDCVLLKSVTTEAQFFAVIARPRLAALISPALRDWLAHVVESSELIAVSEHIAECRGPTDDKFLELAVAGHADVILTGDNDLLVLHPFRGIRIISPATFIRDMTHR